MDICGRPLLWHVIERVKAATTVEEIVVATTDKPEDASLREFLKEQDVRVFLGSEDDVLDRFYQAAKVVGLLGEESGHLLREKLEVIGEMQPASGKGNDRFVLRSQVEVFPAETQLSQQFAQRACSCPRLSVIGDGV